MSIGSAKIDTGGRKTLASAAGLRYNTAKEIIRRGLHFMIIVGICGASGSGKSTLAKRIQDSLSCSCVIIGQDCYYKSFPELPFEER